MIGLDTNVIVRYLVQDDPKQSKIASNYIEKTVEQGKILWLSQITFCEVAWVLERSYELNRNEIAEVFVELLETPQLQIENSEVIWKALDDFRDGSSTGFADCLIGRMNEHNGCKTTATFDKQAAKHLHATFTLLK